jgi:PAS domain S-box-containing protein
MKKLSVGSPRAWKFQSQLVFIFAIVVLCFSLVGALANSWLASKKILGQLLDQGGQIATSFARQSTLALLYGLGENAREAAETTLGFPGVKHVAIYDTRGKNLLEQGEPSDWVPASMLFPIDRPLVHETPVAWHFLAPVYESEEAEGLGSPFELRATQRQLTGYVHVVLGKAGLKAMRRSIFLDNFLSTFVFAAILLILLQWLTARLTRPLNDLARLMKAAEQGDIDVRSSLRGSKEILNMSQAFNKMLSVLGERAARLDHQNAMLLREMEERKQAESLLKESEARFRAVIENAVDGIITVDTKGIIQSVNPAAEEMFRYSSRELTGGSVRRLMPDQYASEHADYLERYGEQNAAGLVGSGPREFEGQRKDGTVFPLDLAVSEMWSEGHRLFIGIVRDITERRQAEQQLIEYRDHLQEMVDEQTRDLIDARDAALVAERAMSTFLANMSHELRTPLHGILSFASFGMTKLDRVSKEKLYQYFLEIHDSGSHLLRLLNDLLDLSKLRAGKMTYDFRAADIDHTVRVVVNEFEGLLEEKAIRVLFNDVVPLKLIMMDENRIAQVVRNLMSNAVKFCPAGSTIEIAINYRPDDTVCVSVSDQGVGIPEDELECVFSPFTQSSNTRTNAGGTGLGLPICKEIVQGGHHGWIRAENREQGGTTVTFCIPAIGEK